jgi:hypothetical protein
MTTLQVQLPESLLTELRDLAARENMSVDQFAAAALAEKVAIATQLNYLAERGARGSREKFLRVMSKVPHVPPTPPDQPPPQ